MFKKFITVVMIFSIFTVNANATSQQGALKAAFDDLNFALTVKWDQHDQKFKNEETNKFKSRLHELQDAGLTNEELINFVAAEVKDENAARNIKTAFNVISINKMSPEEGSRYIVETLEKSYNAGASWSGEAVMVSAIFTLVMVAVGAAIIYNYKSESDSSGGQCRSTYTVCEDTEFHGHIVSTCYDYCN